MSLLRIRSCEPVRRCSLVLVAGLLAWSGCRVTNPAFGLEEHVDGTGDEGLDTGEGDESSTTPSEDADDDDADDDDADDDNDDDDDDDAKDDDDDDGDDDDGDDDDDPSTSDTSDDSETGSTSGDDPSPDPIELLPEADTWLREMIPDDVYGDSTELRIGAGTEEPRANRVAVLFDLDAYLPTCAISRAELQLYFYADGEPEWNVHSPEISVYALMSAWEEATANWVQRGIESQWGAPGGDFNTQPVATVLVAGGDIGWVTWEVTDLVIDWCNGTLDNQGFLLFETGDSLKIETRKSFYSREFDEVPGLGPRLRIEFE